jgi:quinol monooxygenase YgiN
METGMHDKVTLLVEFRVEPGRLDAFRAAGRAFRASVERHEMGTLVYDWWLSEDGKRAVNVEVFADPDALVAHMANVAPLQGDLAAAATLVRLDVLGALSEDARAAIEASATGWFSRLGGIDRERMPGQPAEQG